MIPAQHVLDQAADWLSAANRPVIIAGLDAVNEDAAAALTEMAERFAIPVVTTYKAKGLLPEDHALALGGAGLSPLADTHLLPLIKEADLIICAGYDPIEMRPGWQNIWDASQVNVIDITAVPNHHYMHQATLNIIGNTPATLNALNAAATPRSVWADGQIKQTKSALAAAFPKDDAWGPAAVVDVCREELPRDTLATLDSGAHRILLSQMWECYAPRGLMQSSALCTMGCAIPLAIGAHFIEPDRTMVSFCGDAGFLMVAGELTTAKELNLNTIFVVFVDASLALIELKQRQRQLTNNGVDFAQHDFAAMGKAFGGNGHTVHTRDELRVALKAAQKAQEFTVIAAVIEKGAYDGRI